MWLRATASWVRSSGSIRKGRSAPRVLRISAVAPAPRFGLLDGIPVALRDSSAARAGDHLVEVLKGDVPPYDATTTTKLREAGAVIVGKLNMDEFAMGSSDENSAFRRRPRPLESGADAGWLVRWQRGGSGGSIGVRHAGYGRRAIDSAAGGALRNGGHQADLRARIAVRRDRLRLVAGSGGAVRPHGA